MGVYSFLVHHSPTLETESTNLLHMLAFYSVQTEMPNMQTREGDHSHVFH